MDGQRAQWSADGWSPSNLLNCLIIATSMWCISLSTPEYPHFQEVASQGMGSGFRLTGRQDTMNRIQGSRRDVAGTQVNENILVLDASTELAIEVTLARRGCIMLGKRSYPHRRTRLHQQQLLLMPMFRASGRTPWIATLNNLVPFSLPSDVGLQTGRSALRRHQSLQGKTILVQDLTWSATWESSTRLCMRYLCMRTESQVSVFCKEPGTPQGSPFLVTSLSQREVSVLQVLNEEQAAIGESQASRSTPGEHVLEPSTASVQFSLDEDQGLGHWGDEAYIGNLLRKCNRGPVSSSVRMKQQSGMALSLHIRESDGVVSTNYATPQSVSVAAQVEGEARSQPGSSTVIVPARRLMRTGKSASTGTRPRDELLHERQLKAGATGDATATKDNDMR